MSNSRLGVMVPLEGRGFVQAGLGAALGFPPTSLHPLPAPAVEACPAPLPHPSTRKGH